MTEFAYDDGWDEQHPKRNHNTLLDGEVVLWRNSQWRVTNMFLEAKAEPHKMGPPYYIDLASIQFDLHLVDHVCTKAWVDHVLFIEAYDKARELHNFGISWNSKYETLGDLKQKLALTDQVIADARELLDRERLEAPE